MMCLAKKIDGLILIILSALVVSACEPTPRINETPELALVSAPELLLSDEKVQEIIESSWHYVAMYNVNNKFAFDPANPMNTGGWNRIKANVNLVDHTLKALPRPNNDTLYVTAMLDLTREPVIVEAPAFDSKYVSLMATAYDHYVNIPMSTRMGDFSTSSRVLFYSERTPDYTGEVIEGVDKIVEMTGDYVSIVYRVMPHQIEVARMQRNIASMEEVKVLTLSEYHSEEPLDVEEINFPSFGTTDFDIFENNLLEVIQFVFNHTSFDLNDAVDQKLLALYEPLGVVPGRVFGSFPVADIDGSQFREIAEKIAPRQLARMGDPNFLETDIVNLFKPKGQMRLDLLLLQSILGPIGQPANEAVYPPVTTVDGIPMSAMNDYVIHMTRDELPPALAFWSATLYDTKNGFFIPNDRMKYSVGENTGMKLNDDGGISIYISAEEPVGVPEENWLPLERGDYGIDIVLRIYTPDLNAFRKWSAPQAELIP